ncbi:hypothetical protein H131_04474 [Lysinibacillus sphaericus OT4b.31]|uniref:Uncharacterized protein n=1 Tax=Lysinibacillus sphaericus OT4b.31 TaxID=1285586 RepID=R7ZIH1_LYSSH|nr:hypothetical protein H131_04474 [Lysinibacillus sphaericus OT4b.31]
MARKFNGVLSSCRSIKSKLCIKNSITHARPKKIDFKKPLFLLRKWVHESLMEFIHIMYMSNN